MKDQKEESTEEVIVEPCPDPITLDELKKQNAALLERNCFLVELIRVLAHDLKNFTGTIYSFSGILAGDEGNDFSEEEKKHYANIINTCAKKALRFSEDTINWTRGESLSFDPQMVNINHLVKFVVGDLSHKFEEKRITKSFSFTKEAIEVFADKRMMEVVVRNILANAIKFTPNMGEIDISLSCEKGFLVFSVKDNGIGMSNEIMEGLFSVDKESRQKDTNGNKGTGLGLLTCKNFIEKHNGTIWMESEVGKGSQFFFKIPCCVEVW